MTCPADIAINLVGDKWKLLILKKLLEIPVMRFGELRRDLAGVSQKMLTQQLRGMEQDGLIKRTVYAAVPPKVEYSLTELGRSLDVVVGVLSQWGREYMNRYGITISG